MTKKIHLIAIGGSIMHNLALALHNQGFEVTGSDDQIFEPARSRLLEAGICPQEEGWFAEKINNSLNTVILGMHAKKDNPELQKAIELNLPIYSFPEFIAQQYDKAIKIVVAGSHGKTTTTSMIMHVFKKLTMSFDYLVGAQLAGFKEMVSLTQAPYAVIEGDEYLSSCIDSRPKFLHYRPNYAIITGIAWDHYNVFPTYSSYVQSFIDLIQSMPIGATLIYYQGDPDLVNIVNQFGGKLKCIPYHEAEYTIREEKTFLMEASGCFELSVFGKHNLQNMNAVLKLCNELNLPTEKVCEALTDFSGAAKRLELIHQSEKFKVYIDFAHAPSKVKATLEAVRETYPNHNIVCFLELHTYSSLNPEFIPQYKGSLDCCDEAIVFYDEHALKIKGLQKMEDNQIKNSFCREDIKVISDKDLLNQTIIKAKDHSDIILFLGSGNWGGINPKELF